jgi:hypothetical protein
MYKYKNGHNFHWEAYMLMIQNMVESHHWFI